VVVQLPGHSAKRVRLVLVLGNGQQPHPRGFCTGRRASSAPARSGAVEDDRPAAVSTGPRSPCSARGLVPGLGLGERTGLVPGPPWSASPPARSGAAEDHRPAAVSTGPGPRARRAHRPATGPQRPRSSVARQAHRTGPRARRGAWSPCSASAPAWSPGPWSPVPCSASPPDWSPVPDPRARRGAWPPCSAQLGERTGPQRSECGLDFVGCGSASVGDGLVFDLGCAGGLNAAPALCR